MFFPDIKKNNIWKTGYNNLCEININGNNLFFKNIRDLNHNNNILSYIDKEYYLEKLNKIILHSFPFGYKKLFSHLILEFCFTGKESLFLSVEARRQPSEGFSILKGFFKHYGLIYIWGTKKDLIGLRIEKRKIGIESYELKLDTTLMKQGFIYLINETNSLVKNPQYYNSFYNNCTTNLYDALKINSNKNIKFSLDIIFSSRVPNFLKRYGLISKNEKQFNI